MMNENQKIHLNGIEPKANLYGLVLTRIEYQKRLEAKIRLIYTSIIGVVSLIGSVPVFGYFVSELSKSGFYQYSSLILSDGGAALMYWKEFSLSLVESLPVLSITAVLTVVFILLITSKSIIRDSRTILNRVQLA